MVEARNDAYSMAFIRRMSFGWNCLWTKLVQSIFKVMDLYLPE